jgi:hypothetical protein
MPKSPDSNESTLLELVSRYPDTRALITASRRAMKSAFQRADETADLKAGLISYSFGPGYKGVGRDPDPEQAAVKIGIRSAQRSMIQADCSKAAARFIATYRSPPSRISSAPPVSKLLRATLDAWKSRSGGSVRDS